MTKADLLLQVLVLSSTNHMVPLDCLKKKQGGYAHNRTSLLGNKIMGASFQAPHATPG